MGTDGSDSSEHDQGEFFFGKRSGVVGERSRSTGSNEDVKVSILKCKNISSSNPIADTCCGPGLAIVELFVGGGGGSGGGDGGDGVGIPHAQF